MIEIKNACKAYGAKAVLNNVEFTVKDGTIHGIIGENGSGKTTLIKCLTGIYRLNRGEILYDGHPVFENNAVKEQIGYVADSNQYFDNYSSKDMISFFKAAYTNFSEERFNELNAIFNIDVNAKMKQLSKGQGMRVAYMLNLATFPKYLILDEPTSGLDPVAKKEFFDILVDEVEKRNMTVFISSHHLNDLEKICDEITVIRNGRIIVNNDIDTVKNRVVKVQAVIEQKPENLDIPGLIEFSNIGSIYTLVFKQFGDEEKAALTVCGASFIEEIEVSLEEMFVYTNISGE